MRCPGMKWDGGASGDFGGDGGAWLSCSPS